MTIMVNVECVPSIVLSSFDCTRDTDDRDDHHDATKKDWVKKPAVVTNKRELGGMQKKSGHIENSYELIYYFESKLSIRE